jgi:hypothetical protein
MTKVQALQEEIGKLDSEEFAQLMAWVRERDSEEWDRQIEKDAVAGKFDKLANEAREADARGETTEF